MDATTLLQILGGMGAGGILLEGFKNWKAGRDRRSEGQSAIVIRKLELEDANKTRDHDWWVEQIKENKAGLEREVAANKRATDAEADCKIKDADIKRLSEKLQETETRARRLCQRIINLSQLRRLGQPAWESILGQAEIDAKNWDLPSASDDIKIPDET